MLQNIMPTFRCAAVLFDLDGVLVDSTGSVDRQWRKWARERGIEEEKVIAIAHGVRALEVIRTIAPHLDAAEEVRGLEMLEAGDHGGVAVMPGAVELVSSIPNSRWGVVTSGSRLLATARLQLAGIPVPCVMITADDVTHGKPHPEPYLKGAEALGVAAQECVVIEDAPAGIRAAHAGGMKVIALTSTYRASSLGEADAIVEKLEYVRVTLDSDRKLSVETSIPPPKS
jgi:sugar-phosphatase